MLVQVGLCHADSALVPILFTDAGNSCSQHTANSLAIQIVLPHEHDSVHALWQYRARTISGPCGKAEAHGCPARGPGAATGEIGGLHSDGAHVQEGMPVVYVPCNMTIASALPAL